MSVNGNDGSQKRQSWLMAICFFASGFAGLSYEICWIKKASVIFGSTTFAVSTVTAIFFGGLAIGSYLSGRFSAGLKRPLLTYALLEIVLGVIALLNPALFDWSEKLYRYFYPALVDSTALLALTRLFLVTLVILLPTVLMGATLPLFCSYYTTTRDKISLTVSLLYAINTFGAAIGSAVTGFRLIPTIGINRTIWLSAAINVCVGLVAYLYQSQTAQRDVPTINDAPGGEVLIPERLRRDGKIVYMLFFLSGFVSIGIQVLWVRYLSLLVPNTVYTYTLTITVTLVGIVLGSALIARFGDRTRVRVLLFGLMHILTSLIVLSVVELPPDIWDKVLSSVSLQNRNLWVITLMLLLPSVLSGVSFPLGIGIVADRPSLVGSRVGSMYAMNTAGGISGSLLVGFLFLPRMGLQNSFLLCTALSLFIGGIAIAFLENAVSVSGKSVLIGICIGLWVAVPRIIGTEIPADFLHTKEKKLLDYSEGFEVNLAVNKFRDNKETVLEINRLWQGSSLKTHQVLAAHVPMMFHSNPEKVLILGIGAGQTAASFLTYDLARLDCVDVEPALFGILRKNFDTTWMDDKRVRLIVEDGRNYVSNTEKKYDVISVEIGQTFRPGVASFYTLDFYKNARNRLNPNGIVSQFIPIALNDVDVFRSMVESFIQVFPNSVLWYNNNELLLLGTPSNQLSLTPARLNLLQASNAVRKDLTYNYYGGPEFFLNRKDAFLAGYLCGPRGLARLATGAQVYRDDLPKLEYFVISPHGSPVEVMELIKANLEPISTVLQEAADASSVSAINKIRELNFNELLAERTITMSGANYGRGDIFTLQNALNLNPYNIRHRFLLANMYRNAGQPHQADLLMQEALRIDPGFWATREFGRIYPVAP
jgi:spermidine synthase